MAEAAGVSVSSVQRSWRARASAHWVRQFKLSKDPEFVDKQRDVVGLYVDPPAHAVVFICRRKEPDPGPRLHPARPADEEGPCRDHDPRLQRQRVGIAPALAVEPEVLLMDEPFSALDPVMTDALHDDVLRIWEMTKKTIVMVSHHFEEAVLLADRIGIMKDGRLEEVVEVTLPRPRRQDDTAFTTEVRKLRGFFEANHVAPSALS